MLRRTPQSGAARASADGSLPSGTRATTGSSRRPVSGRFRTAGGRTKVRWRPRRRAAPLVLSLSLGLLAGVPAVPAVAVGQDVSVTWSSEDGAYKLTQRPAKTLAASASTTTDATINVDTGVRYQTMHGQGTVLEATSVYNIARLSPAKREQILNQLFNPSSGNAYNIVRLPLGCSDMCHVEGFYTYDDVPPGQTDTDLSEFSIQRDHDLGVISVAKQALAINPDIRFYMSMWSAPAWMKDNQSLINGGHVKREYYPVLARYQRMAIQAYQAQGIPIHAMTPQNEPDVVMAYPTGIWTPAEMRDYIKHLGPELRNHGLQTQIWIGDANQPELEKMVPAVLDDAVARQYVSGIAVHDYTNSDPDLLQDFRVKYPNLPLHLTERSYYGVSGEIHKGNGQVQEGVRRLIDFYRNGVASWTYWITFTNLEDGGPETGPLDPKCCAIPFTAPKDNLDAYTTNRDYYLYGQFTRGVKRGAAVVGSDQTHRDVSNIAFRNPDNSMVVVVANEVNAPRSITIRSSDGALTDTLPPLSVATYRWAGGPAASDPRVGTFRLVNRAQPDLVLHATNDVYAGHPEARNLVMTPGAWNWLAQRWAITSAGDGYYRLTNRLMSEYVAQGTLERYRDFDGTYFAALSPTYPKPEVGWRPHDGQLWRIEPAGDGYYRFVAKDTGAVLQSTFDAYGGWTDVFHAAATPAGWSNGQQQWRLAPA